MKTLRILLLLLVILPRAWGDDAADYIRQFNKTTDPAQRARLIEQAPPSLKEKLQKLDAIHRTSLRYWRGEDKLRKARESYAVRARGLEDLEMVFQLHLNFWEGSIGAVNQANRKAGLSIEGQQQAEAELKKQEGAVRDRVDIAHTLALNLAPSPAAIDLDKRARQLAVQMSSRQNLYPPLTQYRPITKEERIAADKEIDEIYTEMQKLPKLTTEQVQQEVDAVSDDKVTPNGGAWH